MRRYLLCVAHGRDHEWEAFSLDFDLAVQGRTFEEVENLLRQAVVAYVEQAMAEPEPIRGRLLTRRVPFRTMIMWRLRVALSALFSRQRNDDTTFGFPVSCPA